MKPLHVIAGILAAAFAGVGYWLWLHVGEIWVSVGDDRGAFGWPGLAKLWPVALAASAVGAAVIGFLVAIILAGVAGEAEAKADKAISDMREQARRAIAAEKERADRRIAEAAAEFEEQQQAVLDERRALAKQSADADERVRQVETWAQAKIAEAQVETQAQALRARNAICAAERIKRRIEGKARLEVRKSH